MASAPAPTSELLEQVRRYYEAAPVTHRWAGRCYRSWLAHYYNLIIPPGASVLEIGCGNGQLLAQLRTRRVTGIDLSARQVAAAGRNVPSGRFYQQAGETLDLAETFDYIIISDTLNYAADVQQMLAQAQTVARPDTRLLLSFTSALWRPVFGLATLLGARAPSPQSSWLSLPDVHNLLGLAGWQVIRSDPRLLFPLRLFGLDRILNRWIAPFFGWFCLCDFCVARPGGLSLPARRPTVSIVIPARNESGNIAAAVARTPDLGAGTELIFVEGHSRDDTWAEIQRVQAAHPERPIKSLRQTGRGKGDAVRAGLAAAQGEILLILDADLTVPPEELPKFYEVLASGRAEFANGVRLVYPMEKEAMRFLNLCANKLFSIAFTSLLGQPVKDTLCGTKALWKKDYEKIVANRAFFGEFDPFGDFDLLFGADKLNLQIVDVPIRYRERTYGTSNIRRWRHGWLLLRMVAFGARKLKFV